MSSRGVDLDYSGPKASSRTERILHRQNVIAAAQAASEPKRALSGPVRRWERKWVQFGQLKVLKWVPVKMSKQESTSAPQPLSQDNKENERIINDNAPITRSITASYAKHLKRPASASVHNTNANNSDANIKVEETDSNQIKTEDDSSTKKQKVEDFENNNSSHDLEDNKMDVEIIPTSSTNTEESNSASDQSTTNSSSIDKQESMDSDNTNTASDQVQLVQLLDQDSLDLNSLQQQQSTPSGSEVVDISDM